MMTDTDKNHVYQNQTNFSNVMNYPNGTVPVPSPQMTYPYNSHLPYPTSTTNLGNSQGEYPRMVYPPPVPDYSNASQGNPISTVENFTMGMMTLPTSTQESVLKLQRLVNIFCYSILIVITE